MIVEEMIGTGVITTMDGDEATRRNCIYKIPGLQRPPLLSSWTSLRCSRLLLDVKMPDTVFVMCRERRHTDARMGLRKPTQRCDVHD